MGAIASSQILTVVYRVIDDVNAQQPPGKKLGKSPETVLLGPSGTLDSLALISLLVGCEDALQEAFGAPVKLVDDKLIAAANGPLATVGALAAYAAEQLAA